MKKFLLTFFIAFVSLMTYAQVDTLKLIPGKEIMYELQIDTVKYDYLKKVAWFAGFPEVEATFQEGKKTICATLIKEDDIITLNGKSYLYLKSIPKDWFEVATWEGAPHPRTITLFYGHRLSTKSPVTDEFGTWYSRKDFEGMTLDTVTVAHILKPLDGIKDFYINGEQSKASYDIQIGDTLEIKFDVEEPMDIDNYMLVKDEDAIKVSEQDSFILIPIESIEEVAPVISNVLGDYTIESRKFNINVFPKFAIEELSYTTFRKGNTEKKDYTNTLEISPVVLNGDSVVLEILTNEDKLGPFKKESSKFSWNKDGKDLNDSLYMVEDCKLIIPKYNKGTMDGKYNCIVTNGKITFTVTFDVTSNYPTSNETVDTNDFRVLCQDGHVLISNAVSKHLVISDASGKMLVNKVITSDMEQISVPKNTVLFVTIEGKTIKAVSK